MHIDYLGHSEYIVSISNSKGKCIRILSDSWLSNYAYGDLMQRNPQITIDYKNLGKIDAIFLSHAHCDHFDPYTLMEMYENIEEKPLILLPETLLFLLPLLEQYLPEQKVRILRNKEPFVLEGITLRGLIFNNDYITNEDDVMTLFISNEKEILYAEVDTIPPENLETQGYIYKILTEHDYETILYIATRNELEGNLKVLDLQSPTERKKFEKAYREERMGDFEWQYQKFENDPEIDYPDIMRIKGFMKAIIGQGIIYPITLDEKSSSLGVLSLEEIEKLEKQFSKESNYHFPISSFDAGYRYAIERGQIKKGEKIPYFKKYSMIKGVKNMDVSFQRSASPGPLLYPKVPRNKEEQELLILDLLNNRFLPYWLGNLESPLKSSILASQGHTYVISIKYGDKENYTETHYSYGFGKMKFSRMEVLSKNINEDYWADDIEDFYNGTQELYSNFWHRLNLRKSYFLWTLL